MITIDYEKIAFDRLKGKYKHYCIEWDGLAIDETCPEFLACSCHYIPQTEWDHIQTKLANIVRRHVD